MGQEQPNEGSKAGEGIRRTICWCRTRWTYGLNATFGTTHSVCCLASNELRELSSEAERHGRIMFVPPRWWTWWFPGPGTVAAELHEPQRYFR